MPTGDLVVRVLGDLTKFKADLSRTVEDIGENIKITFKKPSIKEIMPDFDMEDILDMGEGSKTRREKILDEAEKATESNKPESGGGKGGGIFQNILGSLQGGFTKILAPLAVISILAQGMRSLINQVMIVGRLISFIIKPIGDILSVGLMPIAAILKPIGMFFNTIMKPYIQKAREAMRLGASLQKEGDTKGAYDMYQLGSRYILSGLLDIGLSTVAELAKMFVTMFENIGKSMENFKGDGIFGDIIRGIGSTMVSGAEMAKSGIDEIKNTVMGFITNQLDSQLAGAIIEIGEKTGKTATQVYNSMSNLGISTKTIADVIDKKLLETSNSSNTIMGTFCNNTTGWIQKIKDQADFILAGGKKSMTPFEGAYLDTTAMQSVTSTEALSRSRGSSSSTVNQNTYTINPTLTITTNGKISEDEMTRLFDQHAEDYYRKVIGQ